MATQSNNPTLADKQKFVGSIYQVYLAIQKGTQIDLPDGIGKFLNGVTQHAALTNPERRIARALLQSLRNEGQEKNGQEEKITGQKEGAGVFCTKILPNLERCFQVCTSFPKQGQEAASFTIKKLSETELNGVIGRVCDGLLQKYPGIKRPLQTLSTDCGNVAEQWLQPAVPVQPSEPQQQVNHPSYWKYFGIGCAVEAVAVFATLSKMQPEAFADFMKPSGDLADLIHGRSNPSFGDIFSNNLSTGTGIFACVLVGVAILAWIAQKFAAQYDSQESFCQNVRIFVTRSSP